jgi:hypothetical protein
VVLNLVLEVIDRVERGGALHLWFATGGGEARLGVGGSGLEPADLQAAVHGSERVAAAAALAAGLGGRVDVEAGDGAAPSLVFTLGAAHG